VVTTSWASLLMRSSLGILHILELMEFSGVKQFVLINKYYYYLLPIGILHITDTTILKWTRHSDT